MSPKLFIPFSFSTLYFTLQFRLNFEFACSLYNNIHFPQMGQTQLQKLQGSTRQLQQNDCITEQAGNQFIRSFAKKTEDHGDVQKFLQSSSIEIFLKYFVKNTYNKRNRDLEANLGVTNGLTKQQQSLNDDVETLMKNSIRKKVKQFQQKLNLVLQGVRQLYLDGRMASKMQKIAKKSLCRVLNMDYFEIFLMEKRSRKLFLFNSKTMDFFQLVATDNLSKYLSLISFESDKLQNYFETLASLLQGKKSKNAKHTAFTIETETQVAYLSFAIKHHTDSEPLWMSSIKQHMQMRTKISSILIETLKIVFPKKSSSLYLKQPRFQKIKDYSYLILCLLELQLAHIRLEIQNQAQNFLKTIKEKNEVIKKNVAMSRQKKDFQVFIELDEKKVEFLSRIRKIKKEIYKQPNLFLQFGNEGKLDFLISSHEYPTVFLKIHKYLKEFSARILPLFFHYHQLIEILDRASKGLVRRKKVTVGQFLQLQLKLNEKGLLKGFSISTNIQSEQIIENIFGITSKDENKEAKQNQKKSIFCEREELGTTQKTGENGERTKRSRKIEMRSIGINSYKKRGIQMKIRSVQRQKLKSRII